MYSTPDSAPLTTREWVITLPDNPEYRALVSGALLDMANANNWEQVGSLTAAEAAEIWQFVLEQWLLAVECI